MLISSAKNDADIIRMTDSIINPDGIISPKKKASKKKVTRMLTLNIR